MLPGDPVWVPGVLFCIPAVVFLAAFADRISAALVFFGCELPGYEERFRICLLPGNGTDGYAFAHSNANKLPFSDATG